MYRHRPTFVKKTCDKLLRTEPPRGVGGCPPELNETCDFEEILNEGRKNKGLAKGFIRELLTKASAAGAIFLVLPTPKTIFVKDFRLTKGT